MREEKKIIIACCCDSDDFGRLVDLVPGLMKTNGDIRADKSEVAVCAFDRSSKGIRRDRMDVSWMNETERLVTAEDNLPAMEYRNTEAAVVARLRMVIASSMQSLAAARTASVAADVAFVSYNRPHTFPRLPLNCSVRSDANDPASDTGTMIA